MTAKKAYWVQNVKTASTFPPQGQFMQDAETIVRELASQKVNPRGIGSGIRMLQYFINRGGMGLTRTRRQELEKAKRLLQKKIHDKVNSR
jgi:tRNA(adenine34) deaminase